MGAANGLTSSDRSDKRLMLNGYVKVGAGVMDRTTDAVTGLTESDLYFLGASYPLTPLLALDAQVARRDQKRSANDATLLVRA